ncbi:MAG TPA: HdeD family acid-resistance protein [Burkholderiaceae bacterium]|nr:HdeD family acid-resistance protein [Burkholderiaceae bacterium]
MSPMLHALAKDWWLLLLRGLVAIAFGVLAIVWPGVTVLWMVLIYGVFALIDGVLAIVAAIKGGREVPRLWLGITGLAGIAAGVVTLGWPGVTALILLYFIAAWAIVTGVMQIVAAIRVRREIEGEWLLIAGGALSVIFGVVLFARPGAGAIALAFAIGVFAVVYGVLMAAFGLGLRKHAAHADSGAARTA